MILVHFLETITYLTGEVGREYFRKHLIWKLWNFHRIQIYIVYQNTFSVQTTKCAAGWKKKYIWRSA